MVGKSSLFLLVVAFAATPLAAQSVPEGIHSIAKGSEEICGVTAASAVDFENKVKAAPTARAFGETNEFTIYDGPAQMTQWVFAKPSYRAYPMATCRRVFVENGNTMMDRKMRCDDTREDCDAAFVQFNDLDQQAIAAVRTRLK